MKADFDRAAEVYDHTFTQLAIGRYQRENVWAYLKKNLNPNRPMRILELNCGTGEDAIFLAKAGHQVVATDISKKMLAVCQAKITKAGLEQDVVVQQLDMKKVGALGINNKFDLIFSNFGGLNCLALQEIEELLKALQSQLKKGGRFIGVIMPDFCLIESLYFFLKLEFKKVFRRKTKTYVLANVEGIDVKTWYYSPKKMSNIMENEWTNIQIESIGFLPSYLENGLRKNENLIKMALCIDRFLRWTKWSTASDHYIIDATN